MQIKITAETWEYRLYGDGIDHLEGEDKQRGMDEALKRAQYCKHGKGGYYVLEVTPEVAVAFGEDLAQIYDLHLGEVDSDDRRRLRSLRSDYERIKIILEREGFEVYITSTASKLPFWAIVQKQ